MRSSLLQKPTAPARKFAQGDLVQLITSDYELVLLVTEETNDAGVFSGVHLHDSSERPTLGRHDRGYMAVNFELFDGALRVSNDE